MEQFTGAVFAATVSFTANSSLSDLEKMDQFDKLIQSLDPLLAIAAIAVIGIAIKIIPATGLGFLATVLIAAPLSLQACILF